MVEIYMDILTKNHTTIQTSQYNSIPKDLLWIRNLDREPTILPLKELYEKIRNITDS